MSFLAAAGVCWYDLDPFWWDHRLPFRLGNHGLGHALEFLTAWIVGLACDVVDPHWRAGLFFYRF